MIPVNIAIAKTIKAGIELLRAGGGAGQALWNTYFADEIEHGEAGDVARWYTHFMANPPRIERAFARRAITKWPYIAVVILADQDDKRFIGNLADRDEDEERFGVMEEADVGVWIYSENVDELDVLHLVLKKIIRGAAVFLGTLGIANLKYKAGADVQPNELTPETVVIRGQTWTVNGLESSVVNLGAPIANVYVHSDQATFTAGGTTHRGAVAAGS